MSKTLYGSAFALAAIIIVILGFGYGWIMNIIALAHMESAFSGFGVLRAVGIFVAPLGGVLGYL